MNKDMKKKIGQLGMSMALVQTELKGTRHYKDEHGNRLTLFTDGSYSIDLEGK